MTTTSTEPVPGAEEDLDAARRELLALMLAEEAGAAASAAETIPRADRSVPLPLSSAQERIWFLEQFEPGSPLYNFHGVLRLQGPLDAGALGRALGALVDRHEILRTEIGETDGVPFQRVRVAESVPLEVVDLSALPAADREAEARRVSRRVAREPFDLHAGRLLRASLLRLAPEEHWLLVTLHHIAADSWSSGIVFRELAELYAATVENRPAELADLPVQYGDFACWQRRRFDSGVMDASRDYWLNKLAGDLPPLELPADRPRPPEIAFDGDEMPVSIPSATGAAMRRLATAAGTTPFVVLLAAFRVLLWRYSGQADTTIGSPFADRPHVDTEALIGTFVNNVVLRTPVGADASFRDLLSAEHRTFVEATEHGEMPFERLVQAMQPERDRSRTPLFQAMFAYLNAPQGAARLKGLTLTPLVEHPGTSEFDLSLYLEPDPAGTGAFSGRIEFATALFDRERMASMARHFVRLLGAAVATPDAALAALPLMDEEEWTRVVRDWNATQTVFDGPGTVHARFEQQARATPDAVALVAGDVVLDYRALNERANAIAHRLRELGAAPDAGVGIMMHRSADLVAGLLGILKAGAGYVPLDPSFPAARIDYMLDDSRVDLVLTEAAFADRLATARARVVCVDRDVPSGEERFRQDPAPTAAPESLAYTIYTSGSTGQPKGVQIEHRNVVNFIGSILETPGLARGDRLLAVTTVSFDIHVLEIFGPLLAGGTVVLATRDDAIDGRRLHDLIVDHGVTAMQATPATWRLLLEVWSILEPPRLAKILCGGEAFPRPVADALLPLADEVWNMYGPTETTVWSTCGRVTAGPQAPDVGRPLANTTVYVLDERSRPVPAGVWGELHIGGQGVARGYLRRPELNAERFVPDPVEPGGRVYRTGDRARFRRDGTLEIGARTDTQIKIRGYRVELGEIESALAAHAAVGEAVALVREDRAGDQRLVAYLTPRGTDRPDAAALQQALQQNLPDYMIPGAFVWLDEIPRTPNRKVDRKALPAPSGEAAACASGYAEPQTDMEKLVAGIFAEVLAVDRVGRYDNFFDIGGHSLLAMKVVDRFRKATGRSMQPGELFQQTVGQIAAHHSAAGQAPATPAPAEAAASAGGLRSVFGKLFDRKGRG
ncbi:MAG: amino acid adenylation domain-containing protein [Betaproteobacteria bacterium]|nr:amino acid adenylation domain-containing protein [Betaproteobacteria bacterium]